jgi:Xaa-Pro aminopeptidase
MRRTIVFVISLMMLILIISSSGYSDYNKIEPQEPQLDVVKNQMILESAKISDMGMEAAKAMILSAFFQNVTEADVVRAIEDTMTENGSSEYVEAFGVIVASGEQSALPHGDSSDDTNNMILPGEVVVVDLGARYMGYCSDLTRTFFMGNATENMTHIYNVTLEAQEAAIEAVQSGVMARDVDAVARDIISSYGYGENFLHALGHGIGLYIHMPPTLSPSSDAVLFESGDMTITIEPGIYIENKYGVRIEDDVFVERTGYTLLTHFPKDLESAILLPSDFENETDDSKIGTGDSSEGSSFLLPIGIILMAVVIVYFVFRLRGKKEDELVEPKQDEVPETSTQES